jgi:Zn-dependent peptidase ImmA (M78 family)/DNA-binding XRE family transcriptional regulator
MISNGHQKKEEGMNTAISINLRRLRKMKKLRQQELADKAGISRNAYRNIETGASVPRGNNLGALARALEVSVFMLTEEIPRLQSLRFRTLHALSSQQRAERERIAADVAIWLRNFNELERMLAEIKPYRFRRNFVGFDPKNAASEARKALGIESDQCIADICELLDSAGIKLFLLNSTLDKFFGLSVGLADGGPAIAVNTMESIPVERQIFTAAHELGHLLLHSESYSADQADEDSGQESQASIFASYFLMPEERFRRVWSESRGLPWIQSVLHTKRIFRVSYKTVLRRLIDEGATDSSIYEKFSRAYTNLYNKPLKSKEEPNFYVSLKDEPSRLQGADFIADRLSRLVKDALDKELITISRAAEILEISVSKMRERVEEWGVFDDR